MMKKSYTSPKLELITFEVNGSIANDCNYQEVTAANEAELKKHLDPLGTLGVFTGEANSSCSVEVEGYCYFTFSTMTS